MTRPAGASSNSANGGGSASRVGHTGLPGASRLVCQRTIVNRWNQKQIERRRCPPVPEEPKLTPSKTHPFTGTSGKSNHDDDLATLPAMIPAVLRAARRGAAHGMRPTWWGVSNSSRWSSSATSAHSHSHSHSLLERYHDGQPMSPAEKHFVRTELLPEHHAPSSLAAHVARLEARLGRRGDTLDVMAMTSALLARPDRDEARRRDFRSLRMITVDSASTVEIDDGLSAEVAGVDDVHGDVSLVRVFVHVADPTRYLDAEDGLAKVASGRVRTLYLPHGKRPMLPRRRFLRVATGSAAARAA